MTIVYAPTRHDRPSLAQNDRHAVHLLRSWIEASCRHTLPNPQPNRHSTTAMMKIRRGRSSAYPLCFHAGQLPPHQSKACSFPPKKLDLRLDVCQNAIDLLNRDRKPNRPPVNCLPTFLTVHQTRRFLPQLQIVLPSKLPQLLYIQLQSFQNHLLLFQFLRI